MAALRLLGPDDATGYLAMVDDFIAAGEGYPWNDVDTARADFTAFLTDLADEAAGNNLPEGCPRQLTYVLADDAEVLAEFRFRPHIEAPFERYHGHVAYNVRPSARRRGHAARGLALMLDEARDMGLPGIMLTVDDPGNVGSVRVIERNGGRRVASGPDEDGDRVDSYWIDL